MAKNAKLSNYEIGIIKGLMELNIPNQEILGYINNYRGEVSNHINGGRISDIKKGKIGKEISPCNEEKAKTFMEQYSNIADNKKLLFLHIKNGYLEVEESETLEYKESFGSIKETKLLHTIQAMANNKGGFILFGIKEEGQKTKKFIINGLEPKQIENLIQDKKLFSEKLIAHFGEDIKIERGKEEIANKMIGYIEVFESQTKPLINNDGDIYYRYDAETRKIKKLDLIRILENKKTQELKNIFYKHIETILKNGIENSAVLNVETGDIEGKGGRLLIDKSLLSQITFIKEGKFVEKDGAPAYIIKGEVEVMDSNAIIATKVENRNIDDNLVYDCFLKQEKVSNPKEFLKAIAQSSSEWFPIYFYAKQANLDKQKLQDFLSKTQGVKKLKKKLKHITEELPQKQNNTTYKNNILQKDNLIEIIKDKEKAYLGYICNSIMSCDKEELELEYILKELNVLKDYCFNEYSKIETCIKKAIAYIDRIF